MKKFLLLSIAAIPFLSIAQKQKKAMAPKPKIELKAHTEGVDFIHKITNWQDIVTKAKKENKHIFVDCYTTWCGPCKYVSSKVFPLANVGKVYNKNYVNVKFQMDETAKDNADVIASRKVAKEVESKYGINAYPTFLIFNSEGVLVHKSVGAGDDKMMIEKASNSLLKENQYYTLFNQFENGIQDDKTIINLIKASTDAGEKSEKALNLYVEKNINNLYTKENAKLLMDNMETVDGIAFKQMYTNREKWYKEVEKEELDAKFRIAIDNKIGEELETSLPNINWNDLSNKYEKQYTDIAKKSIANLRVMVNLKTENWNDFEVSLKNVIKDYPNMFTNAGEFNALAWAIFENISDKDLLTQALEWSKKSIEQAPNEAAFLDTYASLLYKTGNKEKAIEVETKAMNNAKDAEEKKSFAEVIDKMKKGMKLWKM